VLNKFFSKLQFGDDLLAELLHCCKMRISLSFIAIVRTDLFDRLFQVRGNLNNKVAQMVRSSPLISACMAYKVPILFFLHNFCCLITTVLAIQELIVGFSLWVLVTEGTFGVLYHCCLPIRKCHDISIGLFNCLYVSNLASNLYYIF
jgi:hypothetical protein